MPSPPTYSYSHPPADLSTETGSEKCVGVIGATLGGGVGRLNGLYGMMVDALLSVRMVTASGDIVNASETENPDLFWAIRGAGFNFGIIISATYQVHDLPNKGQVVNADFLFPLNQTQAVFQYFKSMEHSLPAELSLILQTGYEATLGGVCFCFLFPNLVLLFRTYEKLTIIVDICCRECCILGPASQRHRPHSTVA